MAPNRLKESDPSHGETINQNQQNSHQKLLQKQKKTGQPQQRPSSNKKIRANNEQGGGSIQRSRTSIFGDMELSLNPTSPSAAPNKDAGSNNLGVKSLQN